MRHAITLELAHVLHPQNLFVDHVEAGSEPDTFLTKFTVDGTHPYLYENPAISNHVSGTTYIDMSRQLMKAICHLYHDIPLDFRFALHQLDTRYPRWAKTGVPVHVQARLVLTCERSKARFYKGDCAVVCMQEGSEVMRGHSSFSTFPKRIEDVLMRQMQRA